MKTLTIFALFFASLSSRAAPLEGGMAVQAELLDTIRWEQQLCEKGALTSAAMDRENHVSESEIENRLFKLLVACDSLTERREARLKSGVLSSASLPLERDGSIDIAKALALLDRSDDR